MIVAVHRRGGVGVKKIYVCSTKTQSLHIDNIYKYTIMKNLLIIALLLLSSCSLTSDVTYDNNNFRPYYYDFFYFDHPRFWRPYYYYYPRPIIVPRQPQQPRPQLNQPRQAPIRKFPPKREP